MTQYFDQEPTVESKPREIDYQIEAKQLRFLSDLGVFSKNHIDQASDLLIRAVVADLRAREIKRGSLLDLGCGIGVVGIALKRLITTLDLTLVDVNRRALALTEENLRRNQVVQARVLESDALSALRDERFDLIVTNPPIRAGKSTVYRFFEESHAQLNPGGSLYVVIGKKQGAESAKRKLESLFPEVELLEKKSGFSVFHCQHPDEAK